MRAVVRWYIPASPRASGILDLFDFSGRAVRHDVARMASRDGTPADPDEDRNRRYLMGQRLDPAQCCPAELATFVVDNCDFYRPKITRNRAGQAPCGQPSV
jgi:uridine kinase